MNNLLAPIALFAYNRPLHTKAVLDSLALNIEAKDSILYVFCDGAKQNSTPDMLLKIEEVRNIIYSENRFKEVIIKVQKSNKGLANSIIEGVTEVVNIHEKIIVLEDDIKVSKGFLEYMNTALNKYKNTIEIGCIHAWNYNLKKQNKHETFFLKGADCWGWATWARSWKYFNQDGKALIKNINTDKLKFEFNRKNTHPYYKMLQNQINEQNDSWAIRWHASLFLQNLFCLHPSRSLVENIGLDGTGVHCSSSVIDQFVVDSVVISDIPIVESNWFFKEYVAKYGLLQKKLKLSFFNNFRKIISKYIPVFIINIIGLLKKNKKQLQNNTGMWAGNYSNWQEAKVKCSGYDSTIILEKCKNALLKVRNGDAVYERDSVLFDKIQHSWGLLAGLQKATIENNNKLCVVDFGGSLGSTYYQNKDFLNGLNIEWLIVEQKHFVDCGKEFFEDQILKFYHTIDECFLNHKPNVLVLSSVLQYLENPQEWINLFLKKNFEYIILDRTAFAASENDFITIQTVPESIYFATYPTWFFNKQKLIDKFVNYTVVAETYNNFTNDFVINNCLGTWSGLILKLNKE